MTQATAYDLAGLAIKTLLAIMTATWLVEYVAFRRLRPFWRATLTVGLAFAVVGTLAGGWQAGWHGVDRHEALRYAPAALVIWLFYWLNLSRSFRAEMAE
jgi:hypothetical protein